GLLVSFRALLDAAGFDVRVMAADVPITTRPRLAGAASAAADLRSLPEVAEVVPVAFGGAKADGPDGRPLDILLMGADATAGRRPWIVLRGEAAASDGPAPSLIVNRNLGDRLHLAAGSEVTLRGDCGGEPTAAPAVRFRVAGIASFPFDDPRALTAA